MAPGKKSVFTDPGILETADQPSQFSFFGNAMR